jgi:glycyl-tRNA synthetase beta chain
MPNLLLEIGCEELPAWACQEAEAQLPELVRTHLGVEPSAVYVGPRRLAVVVEDLPERTPPEWVKGPPAGAPDKAREGFARRHGIDPVELVERDGVLGFEHPGEPMREVVLPRLREIVHGLRFSKSMRWDGSGHRFPRPVRWACEKLDEETLWGSGTSFGHRFTHGEVAVPSAGSYLEMLRAAEVEPDQEERRRRIVEGLDALGEWSDPLGKLDEVVHMAEWPLVLPGAFDERFLALPERVIVTAMQAHQRYFPLGGNQFAFVADGGDPNMVRAGNERVLEGRLDDARFTFERDVARGIEALAAELDRITYFAGAGTYADKTQRLTALVERLGGREEAREAARLSKADQASELVREFPDLEGAIGAEYARLAGAPEEVCAAVAEQYLPDGADAPLPSSEAGRVLSAADKLDTLTISFSLGHRPSGSSDPYGLRRAAIGLCRLAVEGGVTIPHELMPGEVREFVEERLEGYLDVPVEYVRAARASAATTIGGVAARAQFLAALEPTRLAVVHEVYVRSARLAGDATPVWQDERLDDPAEKELAQQLDAARVALAGDDLSAGIAAAEQLAPVLHRFFENVLVMHEDAALRENRLGLLADVRDTVGALADFSQLPL